MDRKRQTRRPRWFLGGATFAALWCLITLLGCHRPESVEGNVKLESGVQLPNLLREGRLVNAPVGVAAPRSGWIIYAFAPGSSLCEKNSRSVEALADSLSPEWSLLAVAATDEGLQPFLERFQVAVPVLTQMPGSDLAEYQITTTPRTYILDQDWKLIEVLDGLYEGEVAEKLAKRLDVQLTPPMAEGAINTSLAQSSSSQPEDRHRESSRNLCLDREQRFYSPGAKAEVLGLRFECGPGGLWIPIA